MYLRLPNNMDPLSVVQNTPLLKFHHFNKAARKAIHNIRFSLSNECCNQFHNKDIPYASKEYCLQFYKHYKIMQCITDDGIEYYIMNSSEPICILLQTKSSEIWITGPKCIDYMKIAEQGHGKITPITSGWCPYCHYLREGSNPDGFECYTCIYETQVGLLDVYKDRKGECPYCIHLTKTKKVRRDLTPEEEVAEYLLQQDIESIRTTSLYEFELKKQESVNDQMQEIQEYYKLSQSAPAIISDYDIDDYDYSNECVDDILSSSDSSSE